MNQPWVYTCPPSWPPSLLPASYPSGLSQCTDPERPVSCIKPGLAIYFTYGNMHVQCYSLKSCHPRLHPQSPSVCSLHMCLPSTERGLRCTRWTLQDLRPHVARRCHVSGLQPSTEVAQSTLRRMGPRMMPAHLLEAGPGRLGKKFHVPLPWWLRG